MSVIEHDAVSSGVTFPRRPVVTYGQWIVHVALLVAFLFATSRFIGPGIFTIDENAYQAQVDQLVDNGEWGVPYVSGPEGVPNTFAPLALSEVRDEAWFPYVRHAAYPATIAALTATVGGSVAIGWSLVALVGLALAAGVLADRGDRHGVDGRLVFWLTASASPFLIHAHIGWAHLPAAFAVFVAVAAIARSERWSLSSALLIGAGLGLAILLRTEALLVAAGLVVAVALLPRPRMDRLRWLTTLIGVTLTAFAADRMLFRWATDSVALAPSGNGDGASGFLVERFQASIALFFDVGGQSPQHVARLLCAVLLLGAAVMVRRGSDLGLIVVVSSLGCVLGLYGSLNGDAYRGLLGAWPLLAPALVFVSPAPRHRFFLTALFSTWVLLVLTIPADGGGSGWGGRLGLVVLATAVPAVADAVSDARRDVGRSVVVGSAMLASLAVSLSGLQTLASAHETSVVVEENVSSVFATFVGTDELLISTDRRLGRFAPDVAVRLPLQSLPDDEELAGFLATLEQVNSIERIVHLDLFDNDLPRIPAGWSAEEPVLDGSVRLIEITREAP